jgi:hypothetical protein
MESIQNSFKYLLFIIEEIYFPTQICLIDYGQQGQNFDANSIDFKKLAKISPLFFE